MIECICSVDVPACRNGRRGRLKICWWQHRAGSSPAAGTKTPRWATPIGVFLRRKWLRGICRFRETKTSGRRLAEAKLVRQCKALPIQKRSGPDKKSKSLDLDFLSNLKDWYLITRRVYGITTKSRMASRVSVHIPFRIDYIHTFGVIL